MIGELIRADFGFDLPNKANSASDGNVTMFIKTEVPEHAGRDQTDLAGCLHKRLNAYWRTLAKEKKLKAARLCV